MNDLRDFNSSNNSDSEYNDCKFTQTIIGVDIVRVETQTSMCEAGSSDGSSFGFSLFRFITGIDITATNDSIYVDDSFDYAERSRILDESIDTEDSYIPFSREDGSLITKL